MLEWFRCLFDGFVEWGDSDRCVVARLLSMCARGRSEYAWLGQIFVIVISSASVTLSFGSSPLVGVHSSTLCGGAGMVVAILLRALAIVCISFCLTADGSCWIDDMSSSCISIACSS